MKKLFLLMLFIGGFGVYSIQAQSSTTARSTKAMGLKVKASLSPYTQNSPVRKNTTTTSNTTQRNKKVSNKPSVKKNGKSTNQAILPKSTAIKKTKSNEKL